MMLKPDLIPVEDALSAMLQAIAPVTESEVIALEDALGRVLVEPAVAQVDVPPADNSAMDGYALNLEDLPATLPISQRIPAGQSPLFLTPGTCARIFTGAEVPPGANCVVMQEKVVLTDDGEIAFPEDLGLELGENIRPRGQDVRVGQQIVEAGQRLDYRHLGLLASVGVEQVRVYRQLTVAILCTGSELVQPGQPLQPGQIYNSNRFLLKGFLQQRGVQVMDLGSVEDTLEATLEALKQASAADLIISTGGVSVGEEDHIRPAIEILGEISLWRLAIKPGKPLAFGQVQGAPFIGLPGNPVSTFVGLQLFVQPVLRKRAGERGALQQSLLCGVAEFSAKTQIRQEYLRAKRTWRDGRWHLETYPNQNSGVLTSAVWADSLVVMPPHTQVQPGDEVEFISYV